jgi:hypothetical protein
LEQLLRALTLRSSLLTAHIIPAARNNLDAPHEACHLGIWPQLALSLLPYI